MQTTPPVNKLPYQHRAKYPHMGREDAAIWNRYITAHPREFDSVIYDLKVGVGHPADPDTLPQYAKMQSDLSRKRIDAVAFKRTQATIIEVKPYASLSAVGQVQLYHYLYTHEYPSRRTVRKLIICEQYDTDIMAYCRQNHITVLAT